MTKRLIGALAGFVVLLAGLWLILAPFALGIQPKDTDWVDETFTDVWSGIGLAVLGLIGTIAFATALVQSLAERGLITPRPAAAAPASAPSTDTPAQSSELDKLLTPLVAALARDLDRDHTADAGLPNGHTAHANGDLTPSHAAETTSPDSATEALR